MPRPDIHLCLASGITVYSMGAIENDGPSRKITTRIIPETWTATIIWPTEVLTALRAARDARRSGDAEAQANAERALTSAVMEMIDDPPYGRWLP